MEEEVITMAIAEHKRINADERPRALWTFENRL